MTLLLALLPILAAVIPFVLKQITARQESQADPKTQNENRYAQIDKQISSGNSDALTLGGGADLDELDRLQRANGSQRGSAGNSSPLQ
jgi:hypothetical protein